MARNVSNDSLDDIENRSGVLNQTSYSLQDASDLRDDLFDRNDMELLDTSVTELLDDPYRMKLRRNSNYYGFDQSLADSWIYPANYPMRQYQFTITEAALFKNTLVVLPTGLGKTFIAAVVMYNIYRWYPTGKVIFMAPTRPLVSQQIEACYRIMGIPRSDTAEVTGKQPRHKRSTLWQSKRVFYATPQVVLADLEADKQMFPTQQVRLVVIDEAHKAKGRYAYADVVRRIAESNPHFRVLALSATPGRTLEDVAEVIRNLRISHVEVRWDNSIDVLPYVFRKDVRTIVIPLGQTIARVRKELLRLVNPYLQRLLESNVFAHYPGNITSGMLIMRQKHYRENALHQRHPNHSAIIADFGVCISMYHALDLLVKHGIRIFLNFFDDGTNGQEKYFVAKDRQIKNFLDQLREQYHHRDRQQLSTDAGIITGNDDVDFGHPKYRILEQQLMTFFKEFPDSKAIVFCEFRDSVAMIKRMLSNNQPLIRPSCIVGQGGANGVRVAQHEQIGVMRHFRSGTYNTLIATCVAEEGIDVGEVDLIVCFDIAKNPMRFVQRIGRTGRQRIGRVLMLVTEGEEHNTLKQVLASKDKTNHQLARSKDILRILYPHSPRLVPPGIQPECVKMYMNIPDEQAAIRPACSDSSDEEDLNTAKENGRKRKSTRRRNTAKEVIEPSSKRTKPPTRTRDVRDFFSRQRNDPTDALDAGERDIFAVESPNQRSKEGVKDRSHAGNSSIPIDQTIRLGRTDAQVAIDALLEPLARHYRQLSRNKFLCRRKLLDTSNRTQPKWHKTTTSNMPALDDPLDLPDLVPHEMCRVDASQAAEESVVADKSISNLFDSSFSLHELTSNATDPWSGPTKSSKDLTTTLKKSRLFKLKKHKKHSISPQDLCNSPLLLAFNRSVQKKKNSDTFETPVRTNCAVAVPESTYQQQSKVSQRMVLEYFHMNSLDDIFANLDDCPDGSEPETVAAASPQKQDSERMILKGTFISRNLFGELKPAQTTYAPEKLEAVQQVMNLQTSSEKQHKTPSKSLLESGNNVSWKNIDLGTAQMVFEDDSIDEPMFDSPTPSKSSSHSKTTSSKFAILLSQKHYINKKTNTDGMYCLPDKSPYFTASYQKLSPASMAENKCSQKPGEISEPVDTQPLSSKNNHSWFEEVDMNESVIGRKIGRATVKNVIVSSDESFKEVDMNESVIGRKIGRATVKNVIVSSDESFKDDRIDEDSQRFDAVADLIGSSMMNGEETDDENFQSAAEVQSSNRQQNQSTRAKNKAKNIKRPGREFLLTQADLSGDDDNDDDVGDESFETNSLASFVTASDDERCTADMRSVYLQSVRSPLVRRGGFKIPSNGICRRDQLPALYKPDVYHGADDSYAIDEQDTEMCSFIDDNIVLMSDEELSELEVAERLLKERRQRKRQTRCSHEIPPGRKRELRRIIHVLSSDTD